MTLPLPDLLLESFRRNVRVNNMLLQAITSADLDLSDGRGGWTVSQHLGHLVHFRPAWLSMLSPADAQGLPEVIEGESWQKFSLSERDPAKLAEAFRLGDAAALKAVEAALSEGRTFPDPHGEGSYQSNPAHFLQHIIVHDSHHRGAAPRKWMRWTGTGPSGASRPAGGQKLPLY
ncbi:DinB family protein [Deinococcus sp. Marseille-Q6407]|uniref:DinB family protein n=1 Tax=Deinococcus sp. Marseille-Q6407 TaxID=2969223 RepID=UPI0028FC3226|nr:DinB family protein [Deinococcus sp. Marseille-Q6407]